MANRLRLIAATAATSSVLFGSVPASAASVALANPAAAEAVLIPGATVFKSINPIYPIVATTYPDIGIHFHTDANPQVVEYSQNALDSIRAIADGVRAAKAAVEQTDGEVVVIGESMGSMVAWRLAAELAASDDPPKPDDISFVVIAPPDAGIAEYFPEGTFIPILNYRVARIAESPYRTTIVIGEYDGWADPPDRPWNLVASANALMGIAFVHGPPIFTADPADVPPENTTTSADGRVTTVLVPTKQLPLSQPLRLLGVPDEIVDEADKVLRPVIDAGYRRHDEPGDPRPYISDGRIQRDVPAAVPSDGASDEPAQAFSQERLAEKRAEPQQRLAEKRAEPQQRLAEKREERHHRIAERRAEFRSAVKNARDEVKRSVSAVGEPTLHSPRPSAKNAVGTRDR